MALGTDGNKLIKKYERNLRSSTSNPKPHLVAYRDSGNVLTIGWGHTGPDVFEGQTISEAQAETLFQKDVRLKAENWVDRFITVPITQKQRDALISFTYNAGSGSLQNSDIRTLINKDDHVGAVARWKSQNIKNRLGVQQAGLVVRREEESELYLSGTNESQVQKSQGEDLSEPLEEKKIDNKPYLIPYTHSRGVDTMTVDELINSKQFITADLVKKDLLELKFEDKTNHQRLFEALTITQKRQYNDDDETYNANKDYPVVVGATIYLSSEKIKIDSTYQSNITVQNIVENQYWPNILKSITNDPGYVPAFEATGEQHRVIYPQLNVYLWSRALYLQQGETGGFINITRHIERVTTQSDMSIGGNFTVTMAPVIGELIQKENDSTWEISQDLGPVTLGNINRTERREGIRNHSYYEKITQQNDVIFISFEKLQLEQERDRSDVIQNEWVDMIGLVDAVDVNVAGQSLEYGVTIRGRDLIKALMDDNSYFNPYSIGHVNSLFGGALGERYLQGEFKSTAAYLALSIKQKVQFIFHRIASIGYVPNQVFDSFKNLTQATEVTTGTSSGKSVTETKEARGIWRICKVFIDPSVSQLILADDSVSNPDGSINDLLNKIAQAPFVEFFADTYKDKFYLVFRQPPYTQAALEDLAALTQEDPTQNEKVEEQTEVGQTKDGRITNDDPTKTMFVNDEESSAEISNTLDEVNISNGKFPSVININEVDVISDNLRFSNEAYSWFQVEQKGNFAGTTVTLGHVPAIYFDEFAQVFGNRRNSVTSNYSNYKFFEHKEGQTEKDLYEDQAAQQLAYLVETSIYLPFTRTGSITINGDRRIKKGQWIYYRPTQEFFYVKSVNQQISVSKETIDRDTTIQVERGMVRKYINGVGATVEVDGQQKDITVSYFNIVDLTKLRDGIYDTITKGSASDKLDYKADIKINSDVFNYFLRRRQY